MIPTRDCVTIYKLEKTAAGERKMSGEMGRRCCRVLQGADKVARLVREFAALIIATHTRGYPCTSWYTPKHHVDGSTKHMQALCVRRWIVLEQSACTLTAIQVAMLKERRQVFMVQNK